MTEDTAVTALADALGTNSSEDAPELPPLVPPGAAPTINEQLALMQQQMAALIAITGGVVQAVAGKVPANVTDEALIAAAAASEMPKTSPAERRVRIVLEDNDAIPPGGQFVQVDGRPFLLVPGYEVDAPVSLLDVLDHAVMSVPVCDENRNVIGYRDRLRLPYRVVRHSGEDNL